MFDAHFHGVVCDGTIVVIYVGTRAWVEIIYYFTKKFGNWYISWENEQDNLLTTCCISAQ